MGFCVFIWELGDGPPKRKRNKIQIQEGALDIPFINPRRNKMVRGTPAHLQRFIVAPFFVPDLRVADDAA